MSSCSQCIVWILCTHIVVPSHVNSYKDDDTSYAYQTPYEPNVEFMNKLNQNDNHQCDATLTQNQLQELEYKQQLAQCCADSTTKEQTIISLKQTQNDTQQQLLSLQHNHQRVNRTLMECKHKLQASESKQDRYIYGELDKEIESLLKEKESLQTSNTHQLEKIIELERNNAVHEEKHLNDEQMIQSLKETKQSQTEQVRKQKDNIHELRVMNAKYTERLERYQDMQRSYAILVESYSLHENAKWHQTATTLNTTLQQCSIHLKDSKVESAQVSHELGECNVEWGSCHQQCEICKAATESLQQQITQQKEKFTLCSKVSKACKKERRALKNELKITQNEVLEYKQSLTDRIESVLMQYCWAQLDDKQSFYTGCALCAFVVGLMAFVIWYLVNNVLSEQGMEHEVEIHQLKERIKEILSEKAVLESKEKEFEVKLKQKEKQMQELINQQIIQQKSEENKAMDTMNEKVNEKVNDDKNECKANESWSDVQSNDHDTAELDKTD